MIAVAIATTSSARSPTAPVPASSPSAGGIEADPGQFEQPPVVERSGVDRAQHGLGVGHPEVCRDQVGQAGRAPPAVA